MNSKADRKPPAELIAAYRQGLGLAAVAAIRGPDGLRIAAAVADDDGALVAGEAVQERWWCRRAADAERIAVAATARLRRWQIRERAALSAAGAAVDRAAQRLNVSLQTEQDLREEAAIAIARIDGEIERMQRRGELKSVNKSYQAHRLQAAARGERVPRYQDWMRDYKAKLVRELAATLRQL